MRVAVGEAGVFHQGQTCTVLVGWLHGRVVGRELSAFALGHHKHRGVDVTEVLGVVLLEHAAEFAFTEVAGMLEHDVEYELHAALVHFVYEFLECYFGICVG